MARPEMLNPITEKERRDLLKRLIEEPKILKTKNHSEKKEMQEAILKENQALVVTENLAISLLEKDFRLKNRRRAKRHSPTIEQIYC